MKEKISQIMLSLAILISLVCSIFVQAEDSLAPYQITVTTYALENYVEAIGGDRVQVRNFIPAGADLHSWEPTAREMAELSECDLLIANGADLEPWLGKVSSILDPAKVIDTSESVELIPSADWDGYDHHHDEEDADHAEETGPEHEHEDEHWGHGHVHGPNDPHFWLDPTTAEEQACAVYEALVDLAPEEEETFKENFATVEEKFAALKEKADAFKDMEHHDFLITHGAFNYLAHRYGLTQLALTFGDHADPQAGDFAALIEKAQELGLKVVLYDAMESPKQAEVLADAIDGEVIPVQTLEQLSEEERVDGRDYFERMDEILDILEEAMTPKSEDA